MLFLCLWLPVAAVAQTVPHILNQNELGQKLAAPGLGHAAATKIALPRVAVGAIKPFRLRAVHIETNAALTLAELAPSWRGDLGKIVAVPQVSAILVAIGRVCAGQDLALYTVSVPAQNFAGGVLVIRVVAGRVSRVSIRGNSKGADLALLKHYAARIVADVPLRRAALERNILLMQAIPGLTVGSALRPVRGQPGDEELQLGILRKPWEAGFDVNNEGDPALDIVQTTVNFTVNGLFREGEKDQLVFGAPLTLRRYQYYGFVHQEPIGTDGDTLTFDAGDLVTRPVGEANSGTAQIGSLIFSMPLQDTLTRSLTVSVEADLLNSNAALLGQTVSDERTRTLRAGIAYARAGDWKGIDSVSLTVAEGLDVLGARRGSVVYGEPSFTKFSVNFARLQALPAQFAATLRAAGQYSPEHLPASEEFLYGGQEFGQGFGTAVMAGDSGVALAGELRHPIPLLEHNILVSGLSAFGFADWGRIWNVHTQYLVASDSGASAGMGIRFAVLRKFTVSLGVASQLMKPREEAKLERWRGLFEVAGRF